MSKNKKKREINFLISNIFIYLYPEYLLPTYTSELKKGINFNKKLTKKYLDILMDLNWFSQKISKYPIFFKYFYPKSKKIDNFEALEHHIHAYLEDIETTKNKLILLISNIKNDLKKISSNKSDIETSFKIFIQNIYKSFDTSKIRGSHRHGNKRFSDNHVIEGQTAIEILNKDDLKKRLTQKGMNKIEERKKNSFIEGKSWWEKNSKQNYVQIQGLIDEVIKINKEYLYIILDIQPIISNNNTN